jgi:hypothetical protein
MSVLLACALVGQAAAVATAPSILSAILTHGCIFLPALALMWLLLPRWTENCSKRQAFVRGFVATAALTAAEGIGLVVGKWFWGDSEAVRAILLRLVATLVGVSLGCGIGGGLAAIWLRPRRGATPSA